MDYKRQNRIRLLVRKLNKDRKRQAQKIDILCNDLIGAHRAFISKLDTIGFTANFYESILGTTELDGLLSTAAELIRDEVSGVDVVFFLRDKEDFDFHLCAHGRPIIAEQETLINCFTPELVEEICKANKICMLEDLFAMGFECNLTRLSKVSAVTVPLGHMGSSLGFILICRLSQNKLSGGELKNVSAVTAGLSQAIQICRYHHIQCD